MPRLVCPGCEKPLKVRDDSTAKTVRCPACGEKIPLAAPAAAEPEEAVAPRSRPSPKSSPARPPAGDRPAPRKANRRPPAAVDDDSSDDLLPVRSSRRRGRLDDEDEEEEQPEKQTRPRKGTRWHSLGTKWHGLLPLVIVVVLGVFLAPVVLLFPKVGGGALLLVGSTAWMFAFVMTLIGMHRKGFVNDMAAVPFLLRRLALIYFFFRYPFAYPKLLLCWMSLMFLGIAMAAGGSFIAERAARMAPPAPVVGVPGLPAPNAGGNPAAANAGGASDIDHLLADLDSGNDNSCRVAAEKLATMTPDDHRAAVAQKLAGRSNTASPFTRGAVLEALGVWATPAEVPVLIQALEGTDRQAAQAALKNIGKLHDERAVAPVVNCFRRPETQMAAAQALRDMGPMAEKGVLPLLNENGQGGFIRLDAIKVLKDIGTQESVPALQALANGDNIFLKGPAQEALTAINARTPK